MTPLRVWHTHLEAEQSNICMPQLHYITFACPSYITLHHICMPQLHYITLHLHAPVTLHYITLHYITLHYITLHYITLHYITLHYITFACPVTSSMLDCWYICKFVNLYNSFMERVTKSITNQAAGLRTRWSGAHVNSEDEPALSCSNPTARLQKLKLASRAQGFQDFDDNFEIWNNAQLYWHNMNGWIYL